VMNLCRSDHFRYTCRPTCTAHALIL
jgi:hypothetical protein